MPYSVGLAVGLSIGAPCAFILVVGLALYIRHMRRQRQEDLDGDFDIGVRDDALYAEFQDELHRHASCKKHEEEVHSSSNGSSSIQVQPRKVGHTKTGSSYDFYETFIPMINRDQEKAVMDDPKSVDESIAPESRGMSLENLAKQLHGQEFFEKLPSRAATMTNGKGYSTRNSSTDYVTSDATNDSYVFNGKTSDAEKESDKKNVKDKVFDVEEESEDVQEEFVDPPEHDPEDNDPEDSESVRKGKKHNLSSILGGKFENGYEGKPEVGDEPAIIYT